MKSVMTSLQALQRGKAVCMLYLCHWLAIMSPLASTFQEIKHLKGACKVSLLHSNVVFEASQAPPCCRYDTHPSLQKHQNCERLFLQLQTVVAASASSGLPQHLQTLIAMPPARHMQDAQNCGARCMRLSNKAAHQQQFCILAEVIGLMCRQHRTADTTIKFTSLISHLTHVIRSKRKVLCVFCLAFLKDSQLS